MKKVIFMLALFFVCLLRVNALSVFEIKEGDILPSGTPIEYQYASSRFSSFFAYYDKDDNLYESFHTTDFSMIDIDEGGIYYIGHSCDGSELCSSENYFDFKEKIDPEKQKYWQVVGVNNPNVFEYCGYTSMEEDTFDKTENKYPGTACDRMYYEYSGGINVNTHYASLPFIVLKEVEVEEAEYELVCETNGLVKVSIVNCDLSVKSDYNIVDIKITFDNAKYSITDYKLSDNWEDNQGESESSDNTLIITNENGCKECSIANISFVLNEDVENDFKIESSELDYKYDIGIEFKSVVSDTINSSLEEEESQDNPNTVDFIYFIGLGAIGVVCLIFIFNKKKVDIGG